jgi:LEA14-like dessication related protein
MIDELQVAESQAVMKPGLWAALGLAVLAGCAGLGTQLETPEVSFVGIRAVEASLFEQRLEVRLRVRNPNTIELPVKGLDVDVELAGEPFASGVSARQFVVPAQGEAEFDMQVTANAAGALLKIASDRQSREEIGYRLKGKLSTRIGMLRSIPFDESGSLPIGELTGKRKKRD